MNLSGTWLKQLRWITRECIAVCFWLYVLCKLLIADSDLILLRLLHPDLHWVIRFKILVLLAIVSVAAAVMGRALWGTISYVLMYPAITVLWRLPKLLFRRWPLLFGFAPGIHRVITGFRPLFILYSCALLGSVAIQVSIDRIVLTFASVTLVVFLLFHLGRSLRRAYDGNVFASLADFLKKSRDLIERGSLDGDSPNVAPEQQIGALTPTRRPEEVSSLYLLSCIADLVEIKLRVATRARYHDIYLIMSWLYTVFVTIVTFGFLFLSLHKIDSTSFKIGSVATSWDFMAFSLEALTTARVSTIVPSSRVAVLMCYSEAFCAMLIFVILVFTVLTAAREAFREDVECFSRELRLTAGAIDSRIESVCMMTVGEVEKVLHESQFVLVNTMRKSRGLPEFGAPEVIEAKASYPTNS